MMFLRLLVVAWALVSVALSALAFSVRTGFGDALAAAALEGFETIPEAIMQMMGFGEAPRAVVIGYWLALAAAIFLAFKPAGPRA